jgi:hypothetical protein
MEEESSSYSLELESPVIGCNMSITMVTGAEPPDGGGEQLLQPGAGVSPPGAFLRVPNCQASTTFHFFVKSGTYDFWAPNGTRLSARCHFTGPKKLSNSTPPPLLFSPSHSPPSPPPHPELVRNQHLSVMCIKGRSGS